MNIERHTEYVRSVLDDCNRFKVRIRFKLEGVRRECLATIDTGCNYTLLNFKSLGLEPVELIELKKKDIDNKVPYILGYGVSDTDETRLKDSVLIRQGRMLECRAIKFKKEANEVLINNLRIPKLYVGVNYDKECSNLIGMNTLKDWDIHIGKSVISDRIVFLGCPRDRINPQYLEALEKEFKLGTTINSNRIYRGLNVSS